MSQEQYFEVFQQAQKNLEANPKSVQDRFIVDLWHASKNLHAKNVKLSEALEASEAERRHQAGHIDLLETKAELARVNADDKALPSGARWLSSLIAEQAEQQ